MSKKDKTFAWFAAAAILLIVAVLAVSGMSGKGEAITPGTEASAAAEPENRANESVTSAEPIGRTVLTEELANEPEYARTLFDTSYVHTIDVIVPAADWETFLETCTDKEYLPCDLTIDGESFPETAIRAKGNSSMNMLRSGQKYSFKIEFDHYRDETYHGLDKLNLNNMIMDETCMRDYLVYRMMDEFGVDAPLCSYVFLTVNGEDFGLYVAVEGVEESFLERNYGPEYGELYKPDDISDHKGDEEDDASAEPSNGNAPPQGGQPQENRQPSGNPPQTDDRQPQNGNQPANGGQPQNTSGEPSREAPRPGGGSGSGGFGGAADVKLQYIDDDPESYPYIFESAKTDVTRQDQARLIEALRKLSEREDLEATLDTEEVLRYFVSHIFTCNSDSYTGSMIHNYYLYEENGQLSMIPWDYNLAFGQQGSGAARVVNDPIDTPTSSSLESLPMISWIFDGGTYQDRYHTLYREFLAQFIDSGWIDELIEETRALLAPYVERDPRSFCTPSQFQSALDELKLFCSLRGQSIRGQLDGTIPSTTEGQKADSSALIDTSALSSSGEPGGSPARAPGGASGEAAGQPPRDASGEAS